MKKIITVILLCLLCVGCTPNKKVENDPTEKYLEMVKALKNYDSFLTDSDYFNISYEMSRLDDGSYRYYLVIDKPRIAMYDIEILAVEKEEDYTTKMAANAGIFDDTTYNMIPNQANPSKGYMSGIVVSGTTNNPETNVYLLVQWRNEDLSVTYKQYVQLSLNYSEY